MFVLNMWRRKEQEAERLFNNHRMTRYSTNKFSTKTKAIIRKIHNHLTRRNEIASYSEAEKWKAEVGNQTKQIRVLLVPDVDMDNNNDESCEPDVEMDQNNDGLSNMCVVESFFITSILL